MWLVFLDRFDEIVCVRRSNRVAALLEPGVAIVSSVAHSHIVGVCVSLRGTLEVARLTYAVCLRSHHAAPAGGNL